MLLVLKNLLPMPPSDAAIAAQHGADTPQLSSDTPWSSGESGVLDVQAVISELVVGGMS